jgi:hypothetical protein
MGVYGKPKDTLKARSDLQHMKERENLHPENVDGGHQYLCPASYTLSREEKESMFECLNSINVPSGFSFNVKGMVLMANESYKEDCNTLCSLNTHSFVALS